MQDNESYTLRQEAQPLMTFIVTCHNESAALIKACIDSILALLLLPHEREIIVVDDGSTHSPISELMDYGDRIVYVRQQNGGVSTARNRGLQMATGRYVQFVDADDMLVQPAYEFCLDQIRQHDHADMVLFDFTKGDTTQKSFSQTGPIGGTAYLANHNIHGAAWGYLFRRSMAGSLRFTPGVRYGEDEEFTPQLMLRAEYVYVTDAKAYFYREQPASAIHQTDDESKRQRLDDTKGVIMRLNALADTVPAGEWQALQRRIAQLTMDYIYNVITLTRSRRYLEQQLEELSRAGLFPLPDRNYTSKYNWFRRMSSTSVGRSILMRTLPLLKRER